MRGWAMLAATLGVNYAAHRGGKSTMCSITRRALRTDSTVGRAAFLTAWAAFSTWLLRHLLRRD